MRTMKPVLALLTLAAAALPFASQGQGAEKREGIAQLKDVHGNVLVSRQAGLAAGGEAARVIEGSRVITTAKSEVVVVYDNGCEVRLKENQRFRVDRDKPCVALLAQVESILVEPSAAVASGTAGVGSFWTLVPGAGGAAIGLEILRRDREKQPVSPS